MIYYPLLEAVSLLTRRTGMTWEIPDLLEFSSQTRRVLLRAKVQVDESDLQTLDVERPDVWQNEGRFTTYADIQPMEVSILQRDGVATIRHPFDGPRSWPVRKLRITLVDVVVSRISLTAITSSRPVTAAKQKHSDAQAAGVGASGDVPREGRGDRIKRAALIKKYKNRWDTIENDLKNKRGECLSTAAKADGLGWWFEERAVTWARERGKLEDDTSSASLFPTTKHKLRG